jgi:CheY-like chemotaxis protein
MRQQRLTGTRIMLVDDDADSVEIARVMLASEGAMVTSASSADEALEILRADRADAVLCDISMPIHDGFWLLRAMRSEGRQTPMAALTAHASAATRAEVLAAGFQLHITKPADRETLVDAVRELTGRRSDS